MLMQTAKYNFQITQGADFNFSVRLQDCNGNPLNLESFRIKMQIKKGFKANPIDELSTANGRITVSSYEEDGVYDTIEIDFPHTVTVDYPAGVFLYDLQIQSANADITKVLEGQMQCLTSITQQ